jgi:oxygen-independent coproporphyrinogen-3 oxidase
MNIAPHLLEKYNVPVPRYTSYPPANHFNEEVTGAEMEELIRTSNNWSPDHIGFYVHIPFCKKICFYCGCNACTLKSTNEVTRYVEALQQEIRLVAKELNQSRKVTQIHFGGGTPNSIPAEMLEEIVRSIRLEFSVSDTAEIAIETNPAYLDEVYIDTLLRVGFNRFSFGIQDFDPEVLKMVNREPSKLPVDQLIAMVKKSNEQAAVNLDFIYGLPGQDETTFRHTMEKAIALQPDRLVTFSYAHVPWLKKHQQILEKRGLPGPEEKTAMFLAGYGALTSAGYKPIGLDHFVQPEDELYQALQNKQLHRNFQGYCTRKTTGQVYALGITGISQLEKAYIQNTKSIDTYVDQLSRGILPVEKGLRVTDAQVVIREVITRLMCNKQLDWNLLSEELQVDLPDLKKILNDDPKQLAEMEADGLLHRTEHDLTVTETGSLFIRNIAALFDPDYRQQVNKYSKSV